MKSKVELTYGKAAKALMFAVNPFKKKILKTNCTVHKFINIQAIEILKNDNYSEAADFFKSHVRELNEGVTWADQDFKSINHFYHYIHGNGLFGFSNAYYECEIYFKRAIGYMEAGDTKAALFYLGASCHLIQDAAVPQHVNNRLLESHRGFEMWVISKLMTDYSYINNSGVKRFDNLEDYFKNNSSLANATYNLYRWMINIEEKYRKISTRMLRESQVTTAGFLVDFYEKYVKTN